MKKLAWFILLAAPLVAQVSLPNPQSRVAGRFVAFNYGGWSIPLYTVPSGTGSKTFAPLYDTVQLPDGRRFVPFATNASLYVGTELVTITAVGTGCVPNNTVAGGCVLTATFSNTHTNADRLSSGTFGLQEALNDASASGGGTVVVDSAWGAGGGTTALIAAATVATTCMVEDARTGYGNFVTTSAAPGTVRSITGGVTASGTTYANGGNNLTGVRGTFTLGSSTTATGGYGFGTQGKAIISGTMNGSAWLHGVLGQLDISAATLTAGSHLGPVWSDAGATGPAVSCTFCDGITVTNTTATTFHDIIYGYSKAAYFSDLTDNGGGYIVSGTGASAAVTGYLKVKINGADAYIRVYAGAN